MRRNDAQKLCERGRRRRSQSWGREEKEAGKRDEPRDETSNDDDHVSDGEVVSLHEEKRESQKKPSTTKRGAEVSVRCGSG